MPDSVIAALTTWEWRPSILAVCAAFCILYVAGWARLRRHSRHSQTATVRALALYLLGVGFLIYALLSFLDVYGGLLLTIHMLQHLVLLMVAPCLILWANPFPAMLWALPSAWRGTVTLHLQGNSRFRRLLAKTTPMPALYGLYVGGILLWHDPNLYNQAQNNNWIHDLEHVTFFGTALLFWWPIFGASPRVHGVVGYPGRMAALLLCVPPHVIVGAWLSFIEYPVYSYFESVPRTFGMSVMQDQKLAGIIMWIPSSMMYLAGVIILLAQLLTRTSNAESSGPHPEPKEAL